MRMKNPRAPQDPRLQFIMLGAGWQSSHASREAFRPFLEPKGSSGKQQPPLARSWCIRFTVLPRCQPCLTQEANTDPHTHQPLHCCRAQPFKTSKRQSARHAVEWFTNSLISHIQDSCAEQTEEKVHWLSQAAVPLLLGYNENKLLTSSWTISASPSLVLVSLVAYKQNIHKCGFETERNVK